MIISIIIGIALSLLGFLISLFSTKLSLSKEDWSDFSMFYWTSVMIKFSLQFLGLLIFLFVIEIEKIPLLLSFMISYLFFLMIEVLYLNKTKKF
jgi:CBS domain containing-hemolysin-like protein